MDSFSLCLFRSNSSRRRRWPCFFSHPLPLRAAPRRLAGNDIDSVRPQTEGEEELQLQLALAMSREEHEQEERKRRDDEAKEDMKLKMALEESQREDDLVSGVKSCSGDICLLSSHCGLGLNL